MQIPFARIVKNPFFFLKIAKLQTIKKDYEKDDLEKRNLKLIEKNMNEEIVLGQTRGKSIRISINK